MAAFKWAFLNAGAQALLSLAIVMMLARLLTPEDFGLIAVAQVFITLAETVARHGIGSAVIQRDHLTRRHIAAGTVLTFGAGMALAGIIWALAPWLARVVDAPDTGAILRALAVAIVLAGASAVSEHRLRRDLRFGALMVVSVLAKILGGGLVAVGLALANQGVWALVWGVLAQQAVFSLAAIAFAPPPRASGAGRREAADLLRTGAGFSALALLDVLSSQAVNLAVARTLGPVALGLYTRAAGLSVVTARLGPLLRSVLMPAMSRRQHRIDRLRTTYLNGAEMLSLVAFPVSLMIAVVAPEIVAVVLGPQWDGAVPALRILALAGAVQSLNAVHVPPILALGAVYRQTWRRGLCLLLLLGSVWFGSRWGLVGVATAVSGVALVQHVLVAHLTLDLVGLRTATLLRRYLPALWVGAVATAAQSLAAGAVRAAAWPALPALAAELVVWGAAVAAAAYLAPPIARPAFAPWALAQLRLDALGPPGRWAHALLEHLARRWTSLRDVAP